jgi:DNA-directed RNA polymerase specialized sigma subunit
VVLCGGLDRDQAGRRRSCPRESRAGSQDAILVADELLAELATVSPLQAQIAQLRFFCGLTFEQIGTVVGLAEHRVRREWHFAQVWLGSRPAAESWRP